MIRSLLKVAAMATCLALGILFVLVCTALGLVVKP